MYKECVNLWVQFDNRKTRYLHVTIIFHLFIHTMQNFNYNRHSGHVCSKIRWQRQITVENVKHQGGKLTLWLRLADKSPQKSYLIGTFGRQIGPLDSTVLAHVADKLAELIVLARHGRSIHRPRDYQPLKGKTYGYLY